MSRPRPQSYLQPMQSITAYRILITVVSMNVEAVEIRLVELVAMKVSRMSVEFLGRIRAVETQDSLYFDVVDMVTGASLNKFLNTLIKRNPLDIVGVVVSVEEAR